MADFAGRGKLEEEIARFMAREMSRIRRQVEDDLLAAGVDMSNAGMLSSSYWDDLSINIEGFMQNKLEQVYLAAAEQFMDEIQYNFELLDAAQAWAEQAAQHLVVQMNATSMNRVQTATNRFFSQSMTNAQLAEQLQTIFSPSRAELVAVTEVTRAAAEGAEYVAKELRRQGVELVAIWETLVDERVCPICGPRHGTAQGTNWMFLPPAHGKCRCFVNYQVVAASKSFPLLTVGKIISIKVA